MDAIIEMLVDYGGVGMFAAAFMAGSFFPFSSEVVMLGLLAAGASPSDLLLWGTAGNTLGSLFNYGVGSLGRDDQVQKAEIRPAAGALFPQPLFHAGDLYAVRERADSVAPAAEDIRLDAVIGGERIEQAALPPVVHMSGISVCHEGVSFYGCRMGRFRVRSMDTIHLLYNII